MTDAARQGPHIRRIVTGHDASGKSVVWLDGPATNHKFPDEKLSATLMWVTDRLPADYSDGEDTGKRITGTAPPPGGTGTITRMGFTGNVPVCAVAAMLTASIPSPRTAIGCITCRSRVNRT